MTLAGSSDATLSAGLNSFGHAAKPAVPALLQLLRDEKYDPSTAPTPPKNPVSAISIGFGLSGQLMAVLATVDAGSNYLTDSAASALWNIDPKAAAEAHLKHPE